jgi:hypothetical protein
MVQFTNTSMSHCIPQPNPNRNHRLKKIDLPSMIPDKRKQLKIQPPKAKVPHTGVAIGAFEISTTGFSRR